MSGLGIGEALIRAREARGRTLDDAERDTRISRHYLQALEDEHFDLLPAPVYLRGFLRSYARYLGIEDDPLIARLPSDDAPPGAASPIPAGRGATGPDGRLFPPREPTIGVDIGLAGGGGRLRVGTLPGARAATVALVAVFVTTVIILLAFVIASLGDDGGAPAPATPATTPTPGPDATPASSGLETEIGIVPDVVGQSEAIARLAVREAGFEVNVVTERNEQYPRGTVFEQAPAAGVRREPGRSVFIVVSAGP